MSDDKIIATEQGNIGKAQGDIAKAQGDIAIAQGNIANSSGSPYDDATEANTASSKQNADSLVILTTAVEVMADQAHGLSLHVDELVKQRKSDQIRKNISIGLAMALTGALVFIIVLLVQSRSRGIENQKLARENTAVLSSVNEVLKSVPECNTTGSTCYDEITSENLQNLVSVLTCIDIAAPDATRDSIITCIEQATNVDLE